MLKFWQPKASAPEPPADPLQSVFSSYSPVEAHIVGGMLEDNGIKYAVSNEMFAYADSPISNASGGVQVLVLASDADRARALLLETEVLEEDEDGAAG